ncbi:Crp/Fnr family transcriptional regulator [Enemella evansiae]|uniref:Crp/Fnr family transcriptional regulator n=1 Tax=Enemella evansiae TaxID=2016499 RepID=UPI000B9782A8|nr:Crp/Fnr family transcriptional regulator [Enemella evansiae]OYO00215.1 Crp/Fnr family transcriptional regulator [Enemella evansiae]OYO04920.1 Crp/Fnr family transcriptional regulator [Enemella evansiae]OYO09069.1 Crp/Fnr family transcriptional regulator [Enemella evansiae]
MIGIDNVLTRGLPAEVADDLLRRARPRHVRRDEVIFAEGDPGGSCLMVGSGKVKLGREGVSGQSGVYLVIGPGDLFGNLTPYGHAIRRGSALAMTDATLLEIERDDIRAWIERHHQAALRAFAVAVERADAVLDILEDLLAPEIGVRVARALLRMLTRFGRETPAGIRLSLDLSQSELASHIGGSRERVNRALATFVDRGWLTRDGGDYLVHDLAALHRYSRITEAQTERRTRRTSPPSRRRPA